jgi:hypothetical protein
VERVKEVASEAQRTLGDEVKTTLAETKKTIADEAKNQGLTSDIDNNQGIGGSGNIGGSKGKTPGLA